MISSVEAAREARVANPDWWRGAVIYQVYPRSYQDSTGDGVGDLAGITRRLGHIASLGVDALWISPFFKSPMKDFGYDVSDYCDVDPMFGTLADFDALIVRAHELGVKVLIDLVLSHTSDQHPWFQESRADRTNPKADWYVWADPKPDGTPPNNWLSIFGGSAWQWDGGRMQYYLHNFLTSQPDLNFHCPQVKAELLEVAEFWLERGVDGFRLDTINFYTHDAELRDNPALDPALRNDQTAPAVNPYNWQEHLYDKSRPENLGFLRELRAVMRPYGAAAVGEVGDAQRGLEILGQYTRGDDLMHMCYAFELLAKDLPTAQYVADVMHRVERVARDGWACWAFSNHDVPRHTSRWGLSDAATRAYAVLMMCLRGSACLYQGEELGLGEADVAYEDLQDPYGIEFWPEFKGRDGCRTPMVWDAGVHGGFSEASAARPWLPVAPEHLLKAVAEQEGDSASMLAHYRRAVALRKGYPVLAKGAQEIEAEGDVLRITRHGEGKEMLCLFNLSETACTAEAGEGWAAIEKAGALGAVAPLNRQVALGPWGFALLAR
ncbi:alpha-amylase family glycosyl hydrolase [Vannielia sp.]|uniref:alpha-amylase family glycosyl hydrolase n=1 Tax=Vannielia sp. TaxID=2813045 RepID=UPI002635AD63|nr:alpha-amylase family glycosyl hydrolase [Vannielia sp.]MDF1872066.1 alpha-amylase family glycosyl hydrolase [Vannielia sp.]